MDQAFDLGRFVEAQADSFAGALAELRAGRKRGHWMWFVFPQLRGLGRSAIANLYGLSGLAETRAYLAHDLLGPRLTICTQAVLSVEGRTLRDMLGSPDDLKFRSSMTLFALARDRPDNPFRLALDRYCAGEPDAGTLALLAA